MTQLLRAQTSIRAILSAASQRLRFPSRCQEDAVFQALTCHATLRIIAAHFSNEHKTQATFVISWLIFMVNKTLIHMALVAINYSLYP